MMSAKEQKFLDLARMLAESSKLRHKHGAIVVKSGRIVGRGVNKYRNDPAIIESGFHRSQCAYHAEFVAIRQAGNNVAGSTIFVARVSQGKDMLSKPCDMCQEMINDRKVKRVVFTR